MKKKLVSGLITLLVFISAAALGAHILHNTAYTSDTYFNAQVDWMLPENIDDEGIVVWLFTRNATGEIIDAKTM